MNISKKISKYIGLDKIAHFGVHYTAADIMGDYGVQPLIIVGVLLVVGAVKECLDRHNSLKENVNDMTANLSGIVLALVINGLFK